MSIPSLLFFKNGEVVDQVVGAVPKSQLLQRLEKVLA
jgi:thioredoxin 1